MRSLLPFLLALTVAAGPAVIRESFEGEALPADWRLAVARGDCTGRWDAENAFRSQHSLRLAIPQGATARAHWRYAPKVPLKPDTNYRLSVRMLTLNVTGEAYAILYENGEEVPDHWHVTRKVSGSHDWEEYAVLFRTRPDTSWARLILKLRHGTGYAWFDDVVLEESDLTPQEDPGVRQFPVDDGFPLQAMWSPAQWTQRNVLHVVRGELNPLSVFFRGTPDALDRPALVIAASPGLTVAGSLFPGRGPVADAVEGTPDGTQRWRFPLATEALVRASLGNGYRWDRYFHLGLDVPAEAPATGQFTWWFENAGKAGPRHVLPVQARDLGQPLAPASDFRVLIQHTGILRSPSVDENLRMFRYLRLGAVEGGLAPSHYDPALGSTDLALAKEGFASHSWRFEGFGASRALGPRAVDVGGKEVASKICPSAQLSLGTWREALQAYYRKRLANGLKRLIIDYEPPASSVCFCPVCRRAFAEQNALPMAGTLTLPGERLRQQYRVAWAAFCAKRHGEIVRLHCQIIREIVPGAEVGLCSWPGTEAVAAGGGDIRRFEADATFHMPMIYCKGLTYHDRVAGTCARTTIPVLPFIELSDISQPRHLTPDELRMNTLATALSGGGGAVLWVGAECLDAQYLASLRQALQEIRSMRQWVAWRREPVSWVSVCPAAELTRTIQVDGKPIPIAASDIHPYLRQHVWGDAKRAVVAVLNYDAEKDYDMLIQTGKAARTVSVPAGGLGVWRLSRDP
jgi:hypothetical protein